MSNVSCFGENISKLPIVFSIDSRIFFIAVDKDIKIYSTKSCLYLRKLYTKKQNHKQEITCLTLNPSNYLQLISSSLDGKLRIWDHSEITTNIDKHQNDNLQMIYDFNIPILSFVISNDSKLYMCLKPSDSLESSIIVYVDMSTLKNDSSSIIITNYIKLFHSPHCTSFILSSSLISSTSSSSCSYLAATSTEEGGKHSLLIYQLPPTEHDDKSKGQLFKREHSCKLTCSTFHPFDPYIATGDEEGRIVLWYHFQSQTKKKVVRSVLHWHAHAVASLSFSVDGSYLLSAGSEAVVVLWQLSSGLRQFLPRIGAPIGNLAVSPNGKIYAVSCEDNCVRFIDVISSRIEKQLIGLQTSSSSSCFSLFPFPSSEKTKKKQQDIVLVKPTLSSFVTPALQFYSLSEDSHLRFLSLAPARNFVSKREIDEKQSQSEVTHFCMQSLDEGDNNIGGNILLVTVTHVFFAETSSHQDILRFWLTKQHGINEQQQQHKQHQRTQNSSSVFDFECVAEVRSPHESNISAISIHPFLPIVATCSQHGYFKLWIGTQKQQQQKGNRFLFTCAYSGFCKAYSISSCAFSCDGSLLALAFSSFIHLFELATYKMVYTLTNPGDPSSMPFIGITFVPSSALLLAHTSTTLSAFDLFSPEIPLSSQLKIIDWHVLLSHSSLGSSDTPQLVLCVELPLPASLDLNSISVPKDAKIAFLFFRIQQPSFDDNGARFPSSLRLIESHCYFSTDCMASPPACSSSSLFRFVSPSTLVYASSQGQVIRVQNIWNNDEKDTTNSESTTMAIEALHEDEITSKFLGRSFVSLSTSPNPSVEPLPSNIPQKALEFSGASHLVPPPSALFEAFASTLVRKQFSSPSLKSTITSLNTVTFTELDQKSKSDSVTQEIIPTLPESYSTISLDSCWSEQENNFYASMLPQ